MMILIKQNGYSVLSICELVGISRQAYSKRLVAKNSKEDLYNFLEQTVINNRQQRSRAGLRTIYYKENLNSLLGINQFEQEMSARGHGLKPYKSYLKTTDSRGHRYKYDNLISGLEINGENQVIVGDITYYQCRSGLYYIFQFADYYTLEIKGLVGSKSMEGIYAEKCLRQVFAYNSKHKYNYALILHTDGGGQYRSHLFQAMLKAAQIQPSHAKTCLENGLAERENGILKNEYLVDYEVKSISHLARILQKIQYQKNEIWPSKTLGYKTPKQYAEYIRGLAASQRPIKTIKKVE
jgi:transposase InsO family protein